MRYGLPFLLLLVGCASTSDVVRSPDVVPRGMPGTLKTRYGEKVKFKELLGLRGDTLYLLVGDSTLRVPLRHISNVRLTVYKRFDTPVIWTFYTPIMVALSITHGILFLVSAPIELLTGVVGFLGDYLIQYQNVEVRNPEYNDEILRTFSRYPQGVPAFYYVFGDTLLIYVPNTSEVEYRVLREGVPIFYAVMDSLEPGVHTFPLPFRGEVEAYVGGRKIEGRRGRPAWYSPFRVSVSGDSIVITVLIDSLHVRYSLRREGEREGVRRSIGVLRRGSHPYRLNLPRGRYILEVEGDGERHTYRIEIR